MEVNCTTIVKEFLTPAPGGGPLPPIIEGYVVIDAFFPTGTGNCGNSACPAEVDVVAVSTTQGQIVPGQAFTSATTPPDIEVTTVPARLLPAGTWPF